MSYNKEYYEKNKERILPKRMAWLRGNTERHERYKKVARETAKRHRLEHGDEIRAKRNKENAEKRKHHIYKQARPGEGLKTVRLKVLARDNCICQVCSKDAREVHHLDGSGSNRPEKEKNNKMYNLITVCHKCHIHLHLNAIGKKSFSEDGKKRELRNQDVIHLLQTMSQTKVAKIMGVSRQRINQIYKRDYLKGLGLSETEITMVKNAKSQAVDKNI